MLFRSAGPKVQRKKSKSQRQPHSGSELAHEKFSKAAITRARSSPAPHGDCATDRKWQRQARPESAARRSAFTRHSLCSPCIHRALQAAASSRAEPPVEQPSLWCFSGCALDIGLLQSSQHKSAARQEEDCSRAEQHSGKADAGKEDAPNASKKQKADCQLRRRATPAASTHSRPSRSCSSPFISHRLAHLIPPTDFADCSTCIRFPSSLQDCCHVKKMLRRR